MSIAIDPRRGYSEQAPAKSGADLGGSNHLWRTSAHHDDGAIFVPVSYGGCARDAFGHAGFHRCRSANLRTVAPIRCLAASGDDSSTYGVSPMHHHTQGASAPRYLFRVTHPQTRRTETLIASDQHEAATEFAGWHGLPVNEIAITQRSKGWFIHRRGCEPFDLQIDVLDMSASGRHYVILHSIREIRLKLSDVFAEHLLSDEAMDKLRAAMRRCGLSVDAFRREVA